MPRPVVALLTDFGLHDHYVGVMKGVILSGCPEATLVDLTHDIPPQDIVAGALELAASWRYFPRGTVFLAVVDPGVGSARRRLAVDAGGVRFVGPDNGLLSVAIDDASVAGGSTVAAGLQRGGSAEGSSVVAAGLQPGGIGSRYDAVELADRDPLRHRASRTFEGRDWFAPAAARLAGGAALADLGPRVETITPLVLPRPRTLAKTTEGEVLRIDRFGNLITNIDRAALDRFGSAAPRVQVGAEILPLVSTYSDVQPSALCALVGSTGYLEVACSGGSAAAILRAGRGTTVRVLGGA